MITFHALWSLVADLPGYNKSEWLALDKQRNFSPASPEATAEDVAFSAVMLYIKQGGLWRTVTPSPDAQAADRERETTLDAMRATMKRLVAENATAAVAHCAWLELLSELGVNVDFFDDAASAQTAALSTVRTLHEMIDESARLRKAATTPRKRRAKPYDGPVRDDGRRPCGCRPGRPKLKRCTGRHK